MTTSPDSLNGKVALITGAARRIGAQIARTLHDAGMHVALHYRHSAGPVHALCRELNAQRADSSFAIAAELCDSAALPALLRAAEQRWGRLDALINNASAFYPTPIGSVTEAQWSDLIDANLKAPFFLSQLAAPALSSCKGCIVNITDIHGERPLRDHSVYSISKAGLAMMTRALARELAPEIRVNGIAPGAIMWPESEMDEATRADILSRIALKRQGSPVDIARAVLFLLRDAPYVTGQIIAIDGGRSLSN
ncbi:MAG: pteridine reductase [Chromatiales bacterium]|nr:pteridine reductase [Chromatiales bacterium]